MAVCLYRLRNYFRDFIPVFINYFRDVWAIFVTLEHFSVKAIFCTIPVYGTQKKMPWRESNHCQKYATLYKNTRHFTNVCINNVSRTGYMEFKKIRHINNISRTAILEKSELFGFQPASAVFQFFWPFSPRISIFHTVINYSLLLRKCYDRNLSTIPGTIYTP